MQLPTRFYKARRAAKYLKPQPRPSSPPPPTHTHLARQPKQAELQLHTCYCSRLHSVRSEQFLIRYSTQHKD